MAILAATALVLALLALAASWQAERATREASSHAARAERRPLEVIPVVPRRAAPQPIALAHFAAPADRLRWDAGPGVEAEIAPAPARAGGQVLRVSFPATRDGIALAGIPRDWRSFDRLELEVFADPDRSGPRLGLRVDDRASGRDPASRFETLLPLSPGWNPLSVPVAAIGRAIDLGAVARLVLYAPPGPRGRSRAIDLRGVWLRPTGPDGER